MTSSMNAAPLDHFSLFVLHLETTLAVNWCFKKNRVEMLTVTEMNEDLSQKNNLPNRNMWSCFPIMEIAHLLSGNGHVILNIPKYCGLDEVSSVCCHASSTHQLGSFSFPTADVAQDLVELLLIDLKRSKSLRSGILTSKRILAWRCGVGYLRALLSLHVKGVSHHSSFSTLNAALHKLIVDVCLDVRARASTAALALVEEQSKVGLLHSIFHCGKTRRHFR